MSTQAWEDYGMPGSPYFVLVDGAAGRVAGEGSATSWQQVVRLCGDASADRGAARRAAPRTRSTPATGRTGRPGPTAS